MYAKLNAKQRAKASAAAGRTEMYSLQARLGGIRTEIRCYQYGRPIFARASPLGDPGPYARWELHPVAGATDVFTIKNVGLTTFVVADEDGALVVADRPGAAAEFRVQPAGGGAVEIKLRDGDEVWGVKGDDPEFGEIVLQAADGSDTQKISQVKVDY